jgi:hypothetical protein
VTLDEFRRTLTATTPPVLPPPLRALWHDAKGDWDEAHRIAQDVTGADGAWVHAYLHRKEGDLSNARYWYQQAGQPAATDAVEAEWGRIVAELLKSELEKTAGR